MEVADTLIVLNQGRVEQAGTPTDLYDHPASDFVLQFLGPSTTIDGVAVRPHDLIIVPQGEGTPATVTEISTLGFEIRVAILLGTGDAAWIQQSRAEFEIHPVTIGQSIGISRRDATRSPVGTRLDAPAAMDRPVADEGALRQPTPSEAAAVD
jgi:sulfate transport system ATP-binding protein